MDYMDFLKKRAENCDFDNNEDLEKLLNFLVSEAITYQYVATETDKKLKEYITVAEYDHWSKKLSKELLRKSIELSPSADFREFCESCFDDLTADLD